jgi:hypothetical protein
VNEAKSGGTRRNVSLRMLEYICSGNSDLLAQFKGDAQLERIVQEYSKQLEEYGKQLFDMFQRYSSSLKQSTSRHTDKQIEVVPEPYVVNGTERDRAKYATRCSPVLTTCAQINFFRWAFDVGLIDFATRNCKTIRRCMRTTSEKARKEHSTGSRPARKRSSKMKKYSD